jgi:transcriptional regulator with XRE-family HTH domain
LHHVSSPSGVEPPIEQPPEPSISVPDTSPETIHILLGQRIRAARLARGMSLADVGGEELSRSFLSLVELGRCRISVRALAVVARRLDLPLSSFFEEAPALPPARNEAQLDRVKAAVAYSQRLRGQGKMEQALEYALWAAEDGIRQLTER